MLADQADHVLGVDTHRDSHSAAILAADTAIVQGQTTTAANGGCRSKWPGGGGPVLVVLAARLREIGFCAAS